MTLACSRWILNSLFSIGLAGLGMYQYGSVALAGEVERNASLRGLPRLPGPYESRERAVLGLRLFKDPILSANDTVSCATCHKPQFGFADDKPLSQGAAGKTSSRNAPSLLNVAYSTFLFWMGERPVSKNRLQARSRARERWPTRFRLLSSA